MRLSWYAGSPMCCGRLNSKQRSERQDCVHTASIQQIWKQVEVTSTLWALPYHCRDNGTHVVGRLWKILHTLAPTMAGSAEDRLNKANDEQGTNTNTESKQTSLSMATDSAVNNTRGEGTTDKPFGLFLVWLLVYYSCLTNTV